MAAGDERTITLQIIPEVQGEVGSNALLYFASQASVRTIATLPKLEMQVQSMPDMLIGSRQTISIVVKNSGTGVANMRLDVDLPELLKHDLGEAKLSASLEDMRPNEVRQFRLTSQPSVREKKPLPFGPSTMTVHLPRRSSPVHVLAPRLAASISGPSLRYLDRPATFVMQVDNNGTTAATNIDFIAHLPPGMRYVNSTQKGYYDQVLHAVKWGLYELPVQLLTPSS